MKCVVLRDEFFSATEKGRVDEKFGFFFIISITFINYNQFFIKNFEMIYNIYLNSVSIGGELNTTCGQKFQLDVYK